MRTLKIPLYNYLSLLACTPLYNFKKGILIHEKYFKIFSIFMSSVLVMNFILYFYNFLLTVVVYSGETMHVPVLLTFILFHLFDVVVILNQAVLKRKDWMLLLKYMQQTEFVGGNKRFRTAKLFYVPYFIMFIFGTHSVIVWWRFKYKYTLGAFILQSIPDMLVTTTVFLMGNIALLIRYRLLYVNEQLEQITTIVYVVKTLKENLLWKVRQFYKVIELIKLFNNIFGWCILIYSGIILIGFLSTCTLLFDRYYDDYPRTDAMIVVVNRLGIALYLFTCCGMTNGEVNRIGNTAFISWQRLKPNSEVAELLSALAIHASSFKCASISAVNIFDINLTFFFGMLGSVLSYVIIVIQFNQAKGY